MKKNKLLFITATLLALLMLLSSCGTVSNVTKLLNAEYAPYDDVYNETSAISELTGYSVLPEYSNSNFVVLSSGNAPTISYKIFSLNSQKVIATFTNTLVDKVITTYTFTLYSECPLILVTKTESKQIDTVISDENDSLDDIIDQIIK